MTFIDDCGIIGEGESMSPKPKTTHLELEVTEDLCDLLCALANHQEGEPCVLAKGVMARLLWFAIHGLMYGDTWEREWLRLAFGNDFENNLTWVEKTGMYQRKKAL